MEMVAAIVAMALTGSLGLDDASQKGEDPFRLERRDKPIPDISFARH